MRIGRPAAPLEDQRLAARSQIPVERMSRGATGTHVPVRLAAGRDSYGRGSEEQLIGRCREGSSFPCHGDRCDARSRPAGLRSVYQVVTKASKRKVAVKVKLYRLALAASMLALVVEALGAPRKW